MAFRVPSSGFSDWPHTFPARSHLKAPAGPELELRSVPSRGFLLPALLGGLQNHWQLLPDYVINLL